MSANNINNQKRAFTVRNLQIGMIVLHNGEPSLVIDKYIDIQTKAYRIKLVKFNHNPEFELLEYDFNVQINTKELYIDKTNRHEHKFKYLCFSNIYDNYISDKSTLFEISIKETVIDEILKEMFRVNLQSN